MSDSATLHPMAGATHPDQCLRCGYNLTGIANDQACPECGLLAERSRRVTDELHQSRPRWLRRLSRGVWWVLLSVLVPVILAPVISTLEPWLYAQMPTMSYYSAGLRSAAQYAHLFPFALSALMLARGAWLLGSREGYAPADHADRSRRRWLRLAALGPLTPVILVHVDWFLGDPVSEFFGFPLIEIVVLALATLGSVPLVLLLAWRLRDLAWRARSAHLAEHCLIVGIGTAATLVYVLIAAVVTSYGEQWGWGNNWAGRGTAPLLIILAMATAGFFFILWQLYLLARFAIAFGVASRKLRRQWLRDDRARPMAGDELAVSMDRV